MLSNCLMKEGKKEGREGERTRKSLENGHEWKECQSTIQKQYDDNIVVFSRLVRCIITDT